MAGWHHDTMSASKSSPDSPTDGPPTTSFRRRDSGEAPFDVVFHDQGASVEVNTGYGAVVHDQSGAELICGHQRPLEVLRAWIEADVAAAQ